MLQYGNEDTNCYAVKAPCILHLFTRWGYAFSFGLQGNSSQEQWMGPRDSYNMVMTGSAILAIRPTYSYYKLMPCHVTEDNLK